MSAYRGWRILAQRLANLGFDVLRFDYHGTGNSAGEPDEPDRVDAWLASIGQTVAAARAVAATDAVALVGFRLGATLALQAAARFHSVDRLVLWSPFHSGKAYLRELRAFARLSVRDNVPDASKGGDIEAAGFVLTEAAAAALADVDLLSMTKAPAGEVLLVDRDDRPVDARLAERLRALGSRVTSVQPAGTAEALAEPGAAKVPEHIFDDITGWLGQWRPAKSERAAAFDESLFAPAAESGTGYGERVVQFGDGERLFGVITEPCVETNPDTAIVFLNTGCEYNVGPHRLYVPLARHWALRGYLTLRFDLGGIGDSQPPPGQPENLPYPDHALDDVRAAVALVRGRPGIRRVILAGLCSGAWHAFRAACEGVLVEAIFLVNTPLFLGDGAADSRELSEVHELQRYGRSFRDPAKWAKALRGRAGYWTLIRLTVAMLFRKSTRFVRTALGADEPQYYAATMAVILRDLGVPTRVAQGFLPGAREAGGIERVLNSNAHAWVEVYFPGYGWVQFDPTGAALSRQVGPLPSGPPAGSTAPGPSTSAATRTGRFSHALSSPPTSFCRSNRSRRPSFLTTMYGISSIRS
jgi:alpha-beta hydrolase superfamily lysophospholipase